MGGMTQQTSKSTEDAPARSARVLVLRGDGVGPEVIAPCLPILETVGAAYGLSFVFEEGLLGGAAIDACGTPLPQETLEAARRADAVLLGAVGGPKWDRYTIRPEAGLLGIRAELGLFCNLRPARLFPVLSRLSPLKRPEEDGGFDLMIVRELTGGLYYGPRAYNNERAHDTMAYTRAEIERIGRRAFALARSRRKNLVSVDKANVLDSSRLWRDVMHGLRADYPEVVYADMLVDNAAMQLLRRPDDFDVLVTENTFGDILSDEAGMCTGSIGLLPSASLSEGTIGLYEPVHGSAPDIAGRDEANPLAAILSAALMLRFSFGLDAAAQLVENAVEAALGESPLTRDLTGADGPACSTGDMGRRVLAHVRTALSGM